METEELIKLVDGIYKNILDKFNPGARQMINAGKAYLKALHGAAAASRLYVDAISKLARQAQQGTWGGSSDIGAALMKIVEVYKEIQDQQMNILKAFYVDLLVPLETNLEKDTKVVQSEQKRFLQQHKQRAETYSKAAALMKKQRKKSRSSTKTGLAMDKELKNMQALEEEKTKLDAFCEQSLKNAMTQERRRYGFVLERQCSLAKHHLSFHAQGVAAYQQNIDKWTEVAKTREFLPDSVENIFSNRLRSISVWQDDDVYSNPRSPNFEDDRMSLSSQLRKTKSMDASCLDVRSIGDVGSPRGISRAKSEFNLNSSTHSLTEDVNTTPTRRPKSMAVPPPPQWDTQLARALYVYSSGGENQLSFLEGDLIALIGDRSKGWQFGENLRTQCCGWFPLAYTEILDEQTMSPHHRNASQQQQSGCTSAEINNSSSHVANSENPSGNNSLENSTPRMFGDTIHLHRSSNNAKQFRRAIGVNNVPPPQLPAPVPSPALPYQKTGLTQSQSTNFTKPSMDTSTFQSNYGQQPTSGMKTSTSSFGFATPPVITGGQYSTHPQPSRSDRPTAGANLPIHLQTGGKKIGGPVGNVSLHSSNDSGFSNDPPPQPEIDYSDDDSIPGQTKLANRASKKKPTTMDKNNNTLTRATQVRHSQSHGSLITKQRYNNLSDHETTIKEHKNLVKRTKSFWKFGKNASDSEILEGMALWRHRDLVDVEEQKKRTKTKTQRERSNDSERTISNNEQRIKPKENIYKEPNKPARKESVIEKKEYHHYSKANSNHIDQFYDDDDGLMVKTVNRKNILQQYNDSSDFSSDITSDDDPYDCILIEDQQVETKPNVAEIGKKLEKLSKSSKYSPNKPVTEKSIQSEKIKENEKYRRPRHSYETIESDVVKQPPPPRMTKSSRNRDSDFFDDFGDEKTTKKDQFLPRTKLTKTNSSNSNKFEQQGDSLMGYGETLQRRLKDPEYGSKYNDMHNGNMYGPWYDLWGLDATVRK